MAAPNPTQLSRLFGSSFHLVRGYIPGHDGIDIGAKEGTPIRAIASGTVEYARDARTQADKGAKGWAMGGGNVVNINIGGKKAMQYAHLQRFTVREGEHVSKGQIIGYVGRTGGTDSKGRFGGPGAQFVGAHVHFGLWDHTTNKMINPTSLLVKSLSTDVGLPGGTGNASNPGKEADDKIVSLVGAWGDLVTFPSGHILTAGDVDTIIAKLKAADSRGAGCVAEGRACFFAGTSPAAGWQGENVVREILMRHVGEPWDKPLQETLAKQFGDAANEATALGGVSDAIGAIGGTLVQIATYLVAVILLIIGLYVYGKSSSDAGVPVA